jgi:hypothetical protein
MTRRRVLIRTLLADLFFFALLDCVLTAVLQFIYQDRALAALTFALLLPVLAMSVTRHFISNFFLFIGIHLLLLFSPLLLRLDLLAQILFCLFLLACAVYSVAVRLRGDWRINTVMALVCASAAAAIGFVLDFFGRGGAADFLAVWAFVMLLCYILHTQTAQVDSSLDVLSGSAKQPIGTMLRFNNILIAVFLIPVLAAGLLSPLFPLDRLLGGVWMVLSRFLRWIFALIGGLFTGEEVLLEESTQEQSGNMLDGVILDSSAQRPAWIEMLEEIFRTILIIAIAAGAVLLVIYAVYRLYKRFYASRSTDGDVREYIGPEMDRDRLQDLWRGFRSRLPSFGRSEEEKIRRQYFRRVRRHIRKGVAVEKADTTGQIEGKIRPSEDIAALTEQYNHARYGAFSLPPRSGGK